jgi:hypothetical protein
VEFRFKDTQLFLWKETIVVGSHFLNQVWFSKNKNGSLDIVFDDHVVSITCLSTKTKPNKRAKTSPGYQEISSRQIEESQEVHLSAQATPSLSNYTNQYQQQYATENISPLNNLPSNDVHNTFDELGLDSHYNVEDYMQPQPKEITNSEQIPSNQALVVNIVVLVPDKPWYIRMACTTLNNIGFTKDAGSINEQHLFSKVLNSTTRHVLLFPYGRSDRYYTIADYLPYASEVILLVEGQVELPGDIMAVAQVVNMMNAPIWKFVVKVESFEAVDLDYTKLSQLAKLTLRVLNEHRITVIGGAICRSNLEEAQLTDSFTTFLLEWTLASVEKHVVQNIFLCFKFEPMPVQALTEYAKYVLAFFHIEYEPVVVNGSVLVYIRCPSYIPWHILTRKDDIFNTLAEEGLTEIYECFISDVEESMQRPDNELFVDALTFLIEQMISDGISEVPKPNRFRVTSSPVPSLPDKAIKREAILFHPIVDKLANSDNNQNQAPSKKKTPKRKTMFQ